MQKRRLTRQPFVEIFERRMLLSASYAIANIATTASDVEPLPAIADSHGNLFGVTVNGGDQGQGSIYEVAAGTQTATTVASFDGANGSQPGGTLTVDAAGDLFGVTNYGGDNGDGTVFEIPAGTNSIVVLVSFDGNNGVFPSGTLAIDSAGNLYGSTVAGGDNDNGTVFKIDRSVPAAPVLSTLYSFTDDDGLSPYFSVIRDSSGNLYGLIGPGGADTAGEVFKLTASNNYALSVVASFAGYDNFPGDTIQPTTGLTMDAHGNLFGGLVNNDDAVGSLYEIHAGSSSVTQLAFFPGNVAFIPTYAPAVDSSGDVFDMISNLDATTELVEVIAGTNGAATLDSFGAGPTVGEPGSLYIDSQGGVYGIGAMTSDTTQSQIFKIYAAPATHVAVTQQPTTYTTGGSTQMGVTVEDALGNRIITNTSQVHLSITSGPAGASLSSTSATMVAGTGQFTINSATVGNYVLQARSGSLQSGVAQAFNVNALSDYAVNPLGALANGGGDLLTPVIDSSGNLFGTTTLGGANGDGSIYEIPAGTQTPITLVSFDGTNGSEPSSGLTIDSLGNLFGVTLNGGTDFDGTVFELPAGSNVVTTLLSFDGTNGQSPSGHLAIGSDGKIYGATIFGGANGDGLIYQLDLSGQIPVFTALYDFVAGETTCMGGVIRDSSGNIYGTLYDGGANGAGEAFELQAGASSLLNLHSFIGGGDGGALINGLALNAQGDLFGTTSLGGSNNTGTFFKIVGATGTFTTLFSFTDATGTNPDATPVIDSQGNLFGVTAGGGDNDAGTLYEVPAGNTAPLVLGSFQSTVGHAVPITSIGIDQNDAMYVMSALASDSGMSQIVEIYPAHATQIAFTQQPGDYIAGGSTQIGVEVEDALGNLIVTDGSQFALSIANGPAGASLDSTSTTATTGSGQFTVDPTIAGTYTLTVSDGALSPATSNPFTVGAATASTLAFDNVPTSSTSGTVLTPFTVTVLDAFGNVEASDNQSTVALSLAPGSNGATLAGTTSATVQNGIATFANVLLSTTGTFQVCAQTTGLGNATSPAITINPSVPSGPGNPTPPVNPAPTATFVIASAPTYVGQGQAIAPIKVDLTDANGNLLSSDRRAVTLTITTRTTGALVSTRTVNAAAGVATFANLSLATAGTYTLTISDAAGSPATSTVLNVLSMAKAGTSIPPISVVIPPVTSGSKAKQTAKISIQSGPAGGKIQGATSVAAKNGVATFKNLKISKAGSYILQIADSAGVVATKDWMVVPGVTSKLVLMRSMAAVISANSIFSTSVEAVDKYGNAETFDDSVLTVTLKGTGKHPGSLAGTLHEPLVNGVANFSDLSINAAGTYRLTIAGAHAKSVVSKPFKVV